MHGIRPQRIRQKGFSLVELSIVMAIVSVVAVMGLESTAIFMNRTAYGATQDKIAVIKTAMAKHRYVYGYLPCPANQTLAAPSANYGKELRSGANCGGSTVGGLYYGDVPVRDLNLPITYMRDGYGTKMRYVVTPSMTIAGTASGAFANQASVGLVKIRTGKIEEPCGGGATMCQTIGQAAYLVLSFGADKRGSTTTNCAPSTAYDGMIDSVNCRFGNGQSVRVNGSGAVAAVPDDVFYDSRFNNGSVEAMHFDDVLLWQKKSQL